MNLSYRGISRLAKAMNSPAMKKMDKLPPVLELGKILDDFGLKLGGIVKPIPVGIYMIDRALSLGDPMATTSTNGLDPHSHSVPRPSPLNILQPGDTVLVAWTSSSDVVVLCVVVSS